MTKKILYSPSYGAGWSSWNAGNAEQYKFLCEYQPLIDFIEANGGVMPAPPSKSDWHGDSYFELDIVKKLSEEWTARYNTELYVSGMKKLQIKEIPADARYQIHEYDGKESVRLYSDVEDEIWIS